MIQTKAGSLSSCSVPKFGPPGASQLPGWYPPAYSGAGAGAGGGEGSAPPPGALGQAARAPGLLSRSLAPRAPGSVGKEPRIPSSLVNPRMASMLCSREALPPGLRSRWPAIEKLPSAMAGAQPGRCMGRAGSRRAPPALSAAPSALETEKKLEVGVSRVRPSSPRAMDPRSSSAATLVELRALEVGERSDRGRLGRRRSPTVRLPGAGSQGAKACEAADPAPPLWLRTQPLPPAAGRVFPWPRPRARAALGTFHLPPVDPLQTRQTPGTRGGTFDRSGDRVWESAPPSPDSLGPTRPWSHLTPQPLTCLPPGAPQRLHLPHPRLAWALRLSSSAGLSVRGDPSKHFLGSRRWNSVPRIVFV